MIYLSHPEAFAYDLLAIAAIKATRNPNDSEAKGNLMILDNDIQQQVGVLFHEQVCASPEYLQLLKVNDEMYVRIDEMKTREPTGEDARYVDDRVYQRFQAKKALQAKWFPNTSLTEQKFGYTK